MGIETLLYMIPKGGKYAKSVVNFVHKAVKDWPKFKLEIEKVLNGLKGGKLRLDGKQKTIFESNKNTLKAHEKVTKKVEVPPSVKKEFPPFNVSKTEPFKGWTPTLIERSSLRNIFKDKIDPPKAKYTKEMEKIDEELDALVFGGKYDNLGGAKKAKIFEKLQTDMNKLIKAATKEDLTSLSLGQLNKKSQLVQKRIREISNDPNIKGTVSEGPKADMIDAIYTKEATAIRNASQFIKRKNVKTKYGDKFPRLDPDNSAFIITGLDTAGNPIKVSRFTGKFSADKDWKTGDLTRKEGTAWWDRWDPKKNQMRKPNEEVWHETVDAEGKTIMSNPDYQVTTKNIDIWNNINNDVSINELSKQGHKLKDIDMLLKGKEVRKYLEAQKAAEPKLGIYEKMHERTESGQISEIMEDLYIRGDDIYKMTIKEWTKKIPEYFAGGGSVSGFATGGISNLFRERQGFKVGELITQGKKLAKGARWLIKMLKELSDDMIYGRKQFATMYESLKMKYFKETEAAIKHLEAGGEIPANLIQTLRQDARFQGLTVSTTGGKDFIEIQEVVLGKLPKGKGEIIEGKAVEKGTGEKLLKGTVADEELELWGFMNELPAELQHKVALLPIEKQIPLLKKFKKAVDAVKGGDVNAGIDVLQKELLEGFIPKGKPHATGGLIDGYATGGVSNLFRQRQGFQDGTTMDLKYINPAFDTSEGMLSGVGGFPIVPAAVSGIALALSQKDKDKKAPQKKEGPKLPDPKPPFKIGDLIIDFIVANRRQPTPSEELRLKEILRVAKEKAQKSVSKDRKLTKDELDDLYEEFDEALPYPMETVGDKEKFLKAVKDEEAYMFQQYKKGNLDPKPGEPNRKRFLEKKLEEMELSGDKRLMTREEIEELSSFDLGTEMDEAIKKYKQKDIQQKIELSDFDVTGKKGNAEGGLIPGYATGGVSNLFRSR